MSQYPEHEKLQAVEDEAQIVGNFIEWMTAEHMEFAEYRTEHGREKLWPIHTNTEKMLARYFGIDLQKLNDEKEQMIKKIRSDA